MTIDKTGQTGGDREQTELAPLVAAIVQGDENALAQLYERTVDRVYHLAWIMTGNADDTEEITADVYWQVWRRATHYDPERGKVIAWLVVNCRSLAIDLLRRRQARQTGREKLARQVDLGDTPLTATDLIDLFQKESAVRRALEGLSEIQCRLIALAFFHDMSHREIAEAAQLPLGTVKSHVRRGLKKLKETLEEPMVYDSHRSPKGDLR